MQSDEFLTTITSEAIAERAQNAGKQLANMIDPDLTVGELMSLNYQEAKILVHDYARSKVRGLPHGSFLVASRMDLSPETILNAEDEETCIILLRIVGECQLPNAQEMESFKFQAGIRATDSDKTWDHPSRLDEWTKNNLSFGCYRCRVLGTFRMKLNNNNQYDFSFGADLVNFYSGRGMKVYKPVGELLTKIVNYQKIVQKTSNKSILNNAGRLRIGRIRYAASEVGVDEDLDNVPVKIDPTDFVSRRTFYGGMSRGGKSNAMKITAKAVYLLRKIDPKARVGQLIFDPNGEYANDNIQDKGSLRNVYSLIKESEYNKEISTYGLTAHPKDPNRHIVKINFYGSYDLKWDDWADVEKVREALDQLIVGKTIIDTTIADIQRDYIKAFRDTVLDVPDNLEYEGDQQRLRRLVEVYRSTLYAANFPPPRKTPYIKSLFGAKLRKAMRNNRCEGEKNSQIINAADTFEQQNPSWDAFVEACKALLQFIEDPNSGYRDFENDYRKSHDGRAWADDSLRNILQIYKYPNGVRQYRSLSAQHSPNSTRDFVLDVINDLRTGKLVIFDQSIGDPEQNLNAAERILWGIFNRQREDFVHPKTDSDEDIIPPPPIMVYLEEAHNLLPAAGGKDELKTIWARTAKEGSKYRIGMVLATQEPSSVLPAILKNTDNWFVAHLNNSDEIRTLSKFYDFEDYSHQIRSITDPGFVRMRTLSNPFTIPVQVDLFTI